MYARTSCPVLRPGTTVFPIAKFSLCGSAIVSDKTPRCCPIQPLRHRSTWRYLIKPLDNLHYDPVVLSRAGGPLRAAVTTTVISVPHALYRFERISYATASLSRAPSTTIADIQKRVLKRLGSSFGQWHRPIRSLSRFPGREALCH